MARVVIVGAGKRDGETERAPPEFALALELAPRCGDRHDGRDLAKLTSPGARAS